MFSIAEFSNSAKSTSVKPVGSNIFFHNGHGTKKRTTIKTTKTRSSSRKASSWRNVSTNPSIEYFVAETSRRRTNSIKFFIILKPVFDTSSCWLEKRSNDFFKVEMHFAASHALKVRAIKRVLLAFDEGNEWNFPIAISGIRTMIPPYSH